MLSYYSGMLSKPYCGACQKEHSDFFFFSIDDFLANYENNFIGEGKKKKSFLLLQGFLPANFKGLL